jgi:hypothetical protein
MEATVDVEPNEIFRLVVAVGLAPLVFGLARRLRLPSARWPFLFMYLAVAFSYLATVMEEVFAPQVFALQVFDVLQHALTAIGAIAFALAARAVRAEVVKARGGAA